MHVRISICVKRRFRSDFARISGIDDEITGAHHSDLISGNRHVTQAIMWTQASLGWPSWWFSFVRALVVGLPCSSPPVWEALAS
jgi:hypothetical protein